MTSVPSLSASLLSSKFAAFDRNYNSATSRLMSEAQARHRKPSNLGYWSFNSTLSSFIKDAINSPFGPPFVSLPPHMKRHFSVTTCSTLSVYIALTLKSLMSDCNCERTNSVIVYFVRLKLGTDGGLTFPPLVPVSERQPSPRQLYITRPSGGVYLSPPPPGRSSGVGSAAVMLASTWWWVCVCDPDVRAAAWRTRALR